VTHRPGTALRCDEAILLKDGLIAARGAPKAIMADVAAAGQPESAEAA